MGRPVQHDHVFLGDDHARNERRTLWVIALTATTMVVEIVVGTISGSMALVADGWHMATHAGALSITAFAYWFARRFAHDPRFTFGTGKVGDLAAFASAVVLALVALLVAWESVMRLVEPVPISFGPAIGVAVVGLVVNVVSALILREGHHHHHGHGHGHGHDHDDHDHDPPHGHEHRDNNLRAAYLHVVADALTSVLAIVALVVGSQVGWVVLDPLMGVLGAVLIARWSVLLMRDAGSVLLDVQGVDERIAEEIRTALGGPGEEIADLHVWQIGPGHHAAIVAIVAQAPAPPTAYKARLAHIGALSHVTVEVEAA